MSESFCLYVYLFYLLYNYLQILEYLGFRNHTVGISFDSYKMRFLYDNLIE